VSKQTAQQGKQNVTKKPYDNF